MTTLSTQRETIDPAYMAQIRAEPRMTQDEESSVGARAVGGDQEARDEMVRRNLGLVVKFAHGFMRPGRSLMDLISEGNLGLIRAAESFDPTHGVRFSTYAAFWIRQAIQTAVPGMHAGIGLTRHAATETRKRTRAADKLTQSLGRLPREEEIDQELGLSPASTAYARDVTRVRGLKRASEMLDGDGKGLNVSQLPDRGPDPSSVDVDLPDMIAAATAQLTDMELRVINIRFPALGNAMSLIEAGKLIGKSNNWVFTMEKRALAKMRESIQTDGFDPGEQRLMTA
jgi:RNA polymerase primary sigma factor